MRSCFRTQRASGHVFEPTCRNIAERYAAYQLSCVHRCTPVQTRTSREARDCSASKPGTPTKTVSNDDREQAVQHKAKLGTSSPFSRRGRHQNRPMRPCDTRVQRSVVQQGCRQREMPCPSKQKKPPRSFHIQRSAATSAINFCVPRGVTRKDCAIEHRGVVQHSLSCSK